MLYYITPQKPINALKWLKANSPLYADIEINGQWLEQAMSSNEELFTSIVEQSDVNASDIIYKCKTDPFTVASTALEQLAHENGFAIHNVPSDGNCMFSAIAYQLHSLGICVIDSSALRQMVVDHLEDNVYRYINFLSQPLASDNTDTEPPPEEDAYINSIADPELQSVLRWRNYLTKMRNGSWGDHIVLQSIANMFTVTINVLCSQSGTVVPIEPKNGPAYRELYVGLILQYHYVGLDKSTENTDGESHSDSIAVNNVTSNSSEQDTVAANVLDDTIDDAVFDESDRHSMQITGGPQASMMTVENPEATISVTPF